MFNRSVIGGLVILVLAVIFSVGYFRPRPTPGADMGVACKWDPALIKVPEDDTCDRQCALVPYHGGTTNLVIINGKSWHACCAKGYNVVANRDPITKEVISVSCRKDGT